MSTSLIIPKDPIYPPSMDWQLLRREGIRHIENLASDIWTDYNLHDPGITILEVLCYALTDLGYRSNMSPADLFATPNSGSYYTAAQILPCAPVTALDLRKVLIDIPGVQNAWVEQLEDAEVRFFWPATFSDIFAKEKLQSYIQLFGTEDVVFPAPPELNLGKLKKMYDCLSDQDKELARKDFRDDLIARMPIAEDGLKKVLLLYMVDSAYDEAVYFLGSLLFASQTNFNSQLQVDIPALLKELAALRKALQNGQAATFIPWKEVLTRIDRNMDLITYFYKEPLICLYFAGSLHVGGTTDPTGGEDYSLFIPQGIYKVTLRLEEGHVGEEVDIVGEAKKRLHRLRNLSEDIYPDIHIASTIGFGVDLALEVDPTMDKWEVLAGVYRAIGYYLSPTIRFYSLEEMMNRYAQFEVDNTVLAALQDIQLPPALITALQGMIGKRISGDTAFREAVDAVWDETAMEDYYADVFIHAKKYYDADPVYKGPLLQHGFIDEEELAQAQPRQTVYRSDLYQVIAGVAGVLRIDRLDMYVCKEDEVTESGKWCIAFECKCLPELSIDCSRFSVLSNYTEVTVDMDKLKEYLEVHPDSTTKLDRQDMLDLPAPQGHVLSDLTDFTSVQEDFPRTYKIGNTGISKKQPALRQAQAKQLKGYLFFYDQLLANYLTHLDSVKTVLSVKGEEATIYQPLYNIPGIKELLLDYKAQQGEGTDHSWEDFIAGENAYVSILKELTEGNEVEKELYRNRLLDHMLARFGEAFTDYAVQLYRIEKPLSDSSVWDTDEGLEESIADKQRFLQQIPALGAKRASGFVYEFEKDEFRYWKTDNVEGVRKRVCAILGIQDVTRHTITCEPTFEVGIGEVDNLGPASSNVETRYEFYIKPQGTGQPRLLVSTEKFRSFETAKKARLDFLNRAGDSSIYAIVDENLVGCWINVAPGARSTENALLLEPQDGREGAEKRLQYIRDLAAGSCNDDSFHLLEHILLRPRNSIYTEVLAPMVCCVENPEILDPYSFWMTVVLPDWTGRFRDRERRDAFMQTLRWEMPAHLAVRYVLLPREEMLEFETVYNKWIKRLCTPNQPELAEANNALVALMNNWPENQIHYF